MAKLRDVARGKRAVKPVSFSLANAAPEPPHAADEADAGALVVVGVRVLTAGEQLDVFERAQADAKARGVERWDSEHPICLLAQMIRTLEIACVDVDAPDQPFFTSADEIRQSPDLGADNIAYLYEQQDHWQDECSFGKRKLSFEQMVGIIIEEAEAPENADSPFCRMRPSLQLSCLRFMARLWWTSLKASSASSSRSDTDTDESESSTASPASSR